MSLGSDEMALNAPAPPTPAQAPWSPPRLALAASLQRVLLQLGLCAALALRVLCAQSLTLFSGGAASLHLATDLP